MLVNWHVGWLDQGGWVMCNIAVMLMRRNIQGDSIMVYKVAKFPKWIWLRVPQIWVLVNHEDRKGKQSNEGCKSWLQRRNLWET